MPFGFGPTSGPRQAPAGGRHEGHQRSERTSVSVTFTTEEDLLTRLLPPGFSLDRPVVTVAATSITKLSWLAGRGYNTLGVSFPATFNGEHDAVSGQFLAVLWENLADPIISGREELGYAKLYAELPPARWVDGGVRCSASWDGFGFLELAVDDLEPSPAPRAQAPPIKLLHYKYVPATGDLGNADVAYACLTPDAGQGSRVIDVQTGTGWVAFRPASFEQLPTLRRVVNTLAKLPVRSIADARVVQTVGGSDLADQRRLQ